VNAPFLVPISNVTAPRSRVGDNGIAGPLIRLSTFAASRPLLSCSDSSGPHKEHVMAWSPAVVRSPDGARSCGLTGEPHRRGDERAHERDSLQETARERRRVKHDSRCRSTRLLEADGIPLNR
jgi:hypothetical protein